MVRTADATLVLARREVRDLLDLSSCIDAVEKAFRVHAEGRTIPPGVLGTPVQGGGFHVKAAGMLGDAESPPVYVAKVNANFPGNPDRRGLPTIQGVAVLFDASNGRPLALLDSGALTTIRTAAATGVAARHLARDNANTFTICGCGEQSRAQLRAVHCVRPLRGGLAFDTNRDRALRFAGEMAAELGIAIEVVSELGAQARQSDIWITCTPSHRWFVGREHVAAGSFVAAVGADHPEKQEIEPELLAASTVIADILEQAATMGDLHHAIENDVMRREDVRAELSDVVSRKKPGRVSDDEIIIFDSTGTALQDVAAALLVYERACATGAGIRVDLGGRE